MKTRWLFIVLVSMVYAIGSFAQESMDNKLQKMFIIDGEEVTQEYVYSLKPERIKEMKLGVSGEVKDELIKKYGDKVNESNVIVFKLYTDEEMKSVKTVTPQEAAAIKKTRAEELAMRHQESTLVNIGDMAPDFVVDMLDGQSIRLSELRGKVVLLNFWATWCAPCMKEFYEFPDKIVKPFAAENFVLLPISRGEKKDVVKTKMEKLKPKGIDFNVGLDPDKSIYTQYATETIPRIFLIDQNGKVVYLSIGYSEEKLNELVLMIKKILK